jgi:hypothetical protein
MRAMAVLAVMTALGGCAAPAAFRPTPIEVVRVEAPARTEQEKLADYWRERRATQARAQQVFVKPFVEPGNPAQWPESEDQQHLDEERRPSKDPALALRTVVPKPVK